MGAGANWRGRGPGRIEAAADRGAYLRGIDARRLRSGDPRRRRLGRRRRAPANPHARRRELSLPGLGAGWLPTPPPRARASSPWRARYRLGLWVLALGANASFVRKASSAASLLWERRRGRNAVGLSLSRRKGSALLQANDFPDCTGSSRRICKLVRTPWYACLCQS